MNRRQTLKGLLLAPIAAIKPIPKEPETTLRFRKNAIEAWDGEKWRPVFIIKFVDNECPIWLQNTKNTNIALEIPR